MNKAVQKNYVKVVFHNGESECYQVKDFVKRGSLVDLCFDDGRKRTMANVFDCEAFTLKRIQRN